VEEELYYQEEDQAENQEEAMQIDNPIPTNPADKISS
jgi:hypothetical protein